jgi:hypothetical protein
VIAGKPKQPGVGDPQPKCTCPDFNSFGHEPGCPWLVWRAAAADSAKASDARKTAFASSAWLGELEAALKSAMEWEAWAKQHDQRDIELSFGFAAWRVRQTLDSERRHSPNVGLSNGGAL